MRKETRKLAREAVQAGATLGRKTRHGTLVLVDNRPVASLPAGNLDHRALKNARANLRRAGLEI
jgi:hypothetical protein